VRLRKRDLDWYRMFEKYAYVVADNEGVFFLDRHNWSRKQWAAIRDMLPEVAAGEDDFNARRLAYLVEHPNAPRDPGEMEELRGLT
jgi:hypothetical protein